jgi:hypothetical protein
MSTSGGVRRSSNGSSNTRGGGTGATGGWPQTRAAFDRMSIDWRQSRDAGWSKLVAVDGHPLSANDRVIVYHSTDAKTASRLRSSGFNSADKPMNLARLQHEAGENTQAASGRGAGSGLYVGIHPNEVSGHGGRGGRTLAILTKVRDIAPSPEQVALGTAHVPMTSEIALLRNDAMISSSIAARNIRILGGDPDRLVDLGAEWDALLAGG